MQAPVAIPVQSPPCFACASLWAKRPCRVHARAIKLAAAEAKLAAKLLAKRSKVKP